MINTFQTYTHDNSINRVLIKNDSIYSSSIDGTIKAWSLDNQTTKYEINHDGSVVDFVIGNEGGPLENRIVTISLDKTCRVSNMETGEKVASVGFNSYCRSLTIDQNGFVIVVGTDDDRVTFIDTTTFEIVKRVTLGSSIYSLAFNQQNDTLLAVSETGQVYSFKF